MIWAWEPVDAERVGEESISPEPPEGAALTPWIWHVGALRILASRVVKGHVSEFQPSPGSGFLQQGWKGTSSSAEPTLGSGAGGCFLGVGRVVGLFRPSVPAVMLSNFGKEVLKVL